MAEQTEDISLDYDRWREIVTDGYTLIQVYTGAVIFRVSDTEPPPNSTVGFVRRSEDDFNGNYESRVWAKSMGGTALVVVLRKVQ